LCLFATTMNNFEIQFALRVRTHERNTEEKGDEKKNT